MGHHTVYVCFSKTCLPWERYASVPNLAKAHEVLKVSTYISKGWRKNLHIFFLFKYIMSSGTSLVVQWLRIRLPVQGTRVRALVREDPTCRRATKPVCCNYWACALEPASHNYWARVPQLLKPACLEPVLCNKRSHRNEKPTHHNEE